MTAHDPRPVIVVPCYNEAQRLHGDQFVSLAVDGQIRLLFVDDGSTDKTAKVLDRLAQRSPSISVLKLAINSGKGEAVRQGLRSALASGATIVGYYDADLATPPGELLRMVSIMRDDPALTAVLGCRIARLGSSIQRTPLRHYLGRVYASTASLALGVRVYDTQCGAKLFRSTSTLVEALQEPFPSRWSFDVHLIGRLLHGTGSAPALAVETFWEEPLRSWRDVVGSKITITTGLRAFADLGVIGVQRLKASAIGPLLTSGQHTAPDAVPPKAAPRRSEPLVALTTVAAAGPGAVDPVIIEPRDPALRRRQRQRETLRLRRMSHGRGLPSNIPDKRPA